MCKVALGNRYLLYIQTRFPFIEVTKIINVAAVINQFEQIFSIFGYPESVCALMVSHLIKANLEFILNELVVKIHQSHQSIHNQIQ